MGAGRGHAEETRRAEETTRERGCSVPGARKARSRVTQAHSRVARKWALGSV